MGNLFIIGIAVPTDSGHGIYPSLRALALIIIIPTDRSAAPFWSGVYGADRSLPNRQIRCLKFVLRPI